LARKAWDIFQGYEALGGLPAALRSSAPQKLVAAAALEKAQAVGARRLGLVGTNLFPNLRETPLRAAAEVSPAGGKRVDAIAALKPFRAAAGFEALRDASAAFAEKTGARPKVFLAKMGPVAQHKARADFAAGFFAPGGFELLAKATFAEASEAARAASESGAQVVVLCSSDDTYPEIVPVFAQALRATGSGQTLVLAGLPAEEALRTAYAAAGIELFIHLRASVEETLANLLKKIGALK
jgi:methylmalonyl-CoA mutase